MSQEVEDQDNVAERRTIGEQIKKLRRERGLSQEDLARRADVSVVLVSKLEQGVRRSARLTSLSQLAQALDVPLSRLLDKRPRIDRTADTTSLLAIRDVLLTPSALPGVEPAEDEGEATPLERLEAAVRSGWEHYWAGRFGRLATMLPGLIGEARVTARAAGPSTAAPLAQAYRLAACLGVHTGMEDLAAIAAERAIGASTQGNDELLWATLNGTYAWVLLAQGRLAESEKHAARVADRIEPVLSTARPEHLVVWGALQLTALAPAAAAGREAEVGEYLSLARAGAARLEADRHEYQANFGPTEVAVQAAHAQTILGHPRRALDAARAVRREDLRPIAWGRHLLDVAQAQLEAKRDDAAIGTLRAAQDTSAEWFRHQGPARSMVTDLIEHRRRLTPSLRALARAVELS